MSDDNETVMVCVWPDGTWCYPDELGQMTHKSDDFERKLISADMDPDAMP